MAGGTLGEVTGSDGDDEGPALWWRKLARSSFTLLGALSGRVQASALIPFLFTPPLVQLKENQVAQDLPPAEPDGDDELAVDAVTNGLKDLAWFRFLGMPR
jgi:hypothetical protein